MASLIIVIYSATLFFSHSLWSASANLAPPHVDSAPPTATPHPNAPYPPSPVITNIDWAPEADVLRGGAGSDNWWPTWADDDDLYSGYGDGSGFKPYTETPMSLGFARISGLPNHFIGNNIRTPDEFPMLPPANPGEGYVGGRKVEKSAGMLMVDGVLHMWLRNIDLDGHECKLGWSTDHAQTWRYADWTFAEFGFCNFVQFGKNYSDARDNYVYIVAADLPSAYQFGDDYILMRVPKTQLATRTAYEFFQRMDNNIGQPVWNTDINQRGSIFQIPDKARRSAMSYNPALGRYLWWQGYTGGLEQRTGGSFGVYDAPEPWGPWTTVYYTDAWDMGVGDSGSFPSKWFSADGRTINLAFSGADSFSVRAATLTINQALIPPPTPTVAYTATPTLPAQAQQIVQQILETTDDAEERSTDGYVYIDSGDLDMTKEDKDTYTIGLRYQNVALPAGATIQRAYLQFMSTGVYDAWTNLLIQGEDVDAPLPYAQTTNNISERTRTNAAVAWDQVPPWTMENGVYPSPNLAAVVQEMIDRPNWQLGHDLAFVITGYGYRAAWSMDIYRERAPKLMIDYTTAAPTPTSTNTPVPIATSTPLPTNTSAPPATMPATAISTALSTSTPLASSTPFASSTAMATPPSSTATPTSVAATTTATLAPPATGTVAPVASPTPPPSATYTAIPLAPTATPVEQPGGSAGAPLNFYLPTIIKS